MRIIILMFSISLVLLSGCITYRSSSKHIQKKTTASIINNPILTDHFCGFALFDPLISETLIDINGDQLFTPASNMKLLTYLTSINILTDSLAVIHYQTLSQDTLIFTGTGYPLTLNSEVANDTSLIHFLKNRKEQLFYCDAHQLDRFGSGWAWDDAIYSYQRELCPLPIYANSELIIDSNSGESKIVPIVNFKEKLLIRLAAEIDKEVHACPVNRVGKYDQSLNVAMNDSLYIRLLHQSDNFIAEQLLLMCSDKLVDTISTSYIINYAKEHLLLEGKRLRWVDGSGLSRYNLISPNTLITVLQQIYNKIGMQGIKNVFPCGGSGTMEGWYENGDNPYLFAKTGTLSNNHNLSGYIVTKKNRLLLFSFMNNHYMHSTKVIKLEMEKVLQGIYQDY